jgi:hypothetical protein
VRTSNVLSMEKLPLLFQERRSQIKVGKTTWDWHTGYA